MNLTERIHALGAQGGMSSGRIKRAHELLIGYEAQAGDGPANFMELDIVARDLLNQAEVTVDRAVIRHEKGTL